MTRLALIAACLLAVPAAAAETDTKTDAKTEIARKLLSIMFSQETYSRMVDGVSNQVPTEIRDDVRKLIGTYQELSDMQLGLLVKYYTPEEMKELVKFYGSPVGKKSIKVMPEISQDIQGEVMAKLQAGMPAIIAKAKDRAAAAPTAPAAAPTDPLRP